MLEIVLAISETGTLDLVQAIEGSSMLSKILMILGFGAETALFPAYTWLPAFYVGLNPVLLAVEVSSILPAASYIIGLFSSSTTTTALIASTLALIGSIIGSLSAIVQSDIRRLLAYSTLSHTGYIVLGLSSNVSIARDYAILHTLAHAIPKASLISVALLMISLANTYMIRDLRLFRGAYRLIAIGSGLALLGLPPFLSFWTELYIFLGVFSLDITWKALALIYFAVILISTGYAFKLIYAYSESSDKVAKTPRATEIILAIYFSLSLVLSVFQSSIVEYFLR
ncbi:MAG: proton-conducting transporter membrane subunit [Sulfolobales archaeon]